MKPARVLIFGQGQLGTSYKEHFVATGTEVLTPRVDIRDVEAVRRAFTETQPDLVLNCAAKTNIDWCEMHKTEAFDINTLGSDAIARAAQEMGVYLVHVSSGCVQESVAADDVKSEEDAPNPLCYYSWTKVWAENLLCDRAIRHGLKALILRPRQLLSAVQSPRNALVKMLTYTKFIDTPNSCTVVEDLLHVTEQLIARDATGVINVVNPGVTSPFRIAEVLRERVKPDMQFTKISKEELNRMTLAKRIDAVLSTKKLASHGITLPHVDDRLVEIADRLRQYLTENADVLERTKEETREKLALVS